MASGQGVEAPEEPEDDFDASPILEERAQFHPLWRWEHIRSQAAGGDYHLDMSRGGRGPVGSTPRMASRASTWSGSTRRTSRLRDRVESSRSRDHVVLLFDGWALHLSPAPDNIEGHPFHAANNGNGIAATSIDDLQVPPLDPRMGSIEAAYIKKVVDLLHDLPNVIWEVANESSGDGSVDQEFAKFLGMDEPPVWGDLDRRAYSASTSSRVARRARLRAHTDRHDDARWRTRPGSTGRCCGVGPSGSRQAMTTRCSRTAGTRRLQVRRLHWYADPPADGIKVIITDAPTTTHLVRAMPWAWKSFLRGHNPILMDYGLLGGVDSSSREG